jgi:hypothetical protein
MCAEGIRGGRPDAENELYVAEVPQQNPNLFNVEKLRK